MIDTTSCYTGNGSHRPQTRDCGNAIADQPPRNLIRAVEVWGTSDDGTRLEWRSGTYGELLEFAEVSRGTTFEIGECLPGLVWSHRSPIILHSLFMTQFKRAAQARRDGLTCGVGLPVFCGDEFRGVLVFLCDDGAAARGALEVWKLNERRELALSDSYYANLQQFSLLSQFVRFPRGSGLPGQTWHMRFPRLIESLADSPAFMRGPGAVADGLQSGVGLPIMRSAWELDSVVVLLSSAATPLARAVEVWLVEENGELTWHSGLYGSMPELAAASTGMRLSSKEGVAGSVAAAGLPIVFENCLTCETQRGSVLESLALQKAVGLPIYVGTTIVSVVVMLL